MVQQFAKPAEARQIEARARARQRGVRVTVIEPQRAYSARSQTEPGVVYTVARTRAGWTCECDGYQFTGVCKHVAQVERRSEREGWSFGRIAPIVDAFKVDPALGLAVIMAPVKHVA